MSPRSEEFMAEARERVVASRALVERTLLGPAVSLAYYAMLYAARAALSEEDRYAKTHGGTWNAFTEVFVAEGRFDRELARRARGAQRPREGVDYGAARVGLEEAREIVELADRFVVAVEAMLA